MEQINRKDGLRYKEKVYVGGRTLTKTFKTKKEARLWKALTQAQRDTGDPSIKVKLQAEITFFELTQVWFVRKVLTSTTEKTNQDYLLILKNYLNPVVGHLKTSHINKTHAESLVSKMKERKLSAKTINKVIGIFKQILIYGVQNEYLHRNPLAGFAQLNVPQRSFEFLTKLEITRLLDANKSGEEFPIYVLALNTGMRLGEILGLCWDRVDFEHGLIEVSRTLIGANQLQQFTKTKAIRYVPMNEAVLQILKQLQRHQKSPEFVFMKSERSSYNPDHFCQRYFKKALENGGVRNIRFHDLRHTYASHFMMNGGNIFELQKILGHTKMEMTQRYAHMNPQHLRTAANVVQFNITKDVSPQTALTVVS